MARLALIIAFALTLPRLASASVITFGTAPTTAATRDCFSPAYGPLELLDEGGVRVRLNDPDGPQNRYPCDATTTVDPVGAGSGWNPIDLGDGLRPMTIWYMDGGTVSVESLAGEALLGLVVNHSDHGFVYADRCHARVTTNRGAFDLCQGLNQTVSFADYGLFDVQQFSILFSHFSVNDPHLQLLAVQVPEPALGLLLGLVAVPLAIRVRRRSVASNQHTR